MPGQSYTLLESFDYFRSQSNLSPGTLQTYSYALAHFFDFLEHSSMAEPLSLSGPAPAERSLAVLGSAHQDVNLLTWFVNYLGQEVRQSRAQRSGRRSSRLEPATVRLYGQAMITWFRFMADELLLPERFPASAAISKAHRRLKTYIPATEARDGAPEPPQGIEDLIHSYDTLEIDEDLPAKEQHRRRLEGLRNRCLLYALADSGARVSEILRITVDDVRGAKLNTQGIWHVTVRGKGRGRYGRLVKLRFTEPTLHAMQEYVETRGDPGTTDLFVSHARTRPVYRGKPLSSNAVWRMIDLTARRLGLPHIHPHDFRHWRATQMLQEGVPLDQVQRFLNHRSIRTTQLYAKTAERLVDLAGARTSPIARRSSSQ
ncbi:MAG: tyrosine-type recombinase/integrase [Anaerolineales bacterium]|nr:tyrosine-type recombinase/integrase [Anaerolineales bacterium]